MHKSPATLRRWIAATGGDLPYPSSPDQLPATLLLQLQRQDPELLQLIQGTASAALELQVLENTLPDIAATAAERADAATAARIEQLAASNPYGTAGYYREDGSLVPPTTGNMTQALELESLAPELAAKLKAEAHPAAPTGMSEEEAARVNARLASRGAAA